MGNFPSILKVIFAQHTITVSFSFSIFGISSHSLLACKASAKKSVDGLQGETRLLGLGPQRHPSLHSAGHVVQGACGEAVEVGSGAQAEQSGHALGTGYVQGWGWGFWP